MATHSSKTKARAHGPLQATLQASLAALDNRPVPHHPSAKHWRDYQAAVRAHNACPEDDAALQVAFSEAQDRFIYAEDATLQGIYFKLRLLDQSQNLTGYLDENPNLMWPRIILTILRDLKALGTLEEPNGEY